MENYTTNPEQFDQPLSAEMQGSELISGLLTSCVLGDSMGVLDSETPACPHSPTKPLRNHA